MKTISALSSLTSVFTSSRLRRSVAAILTLALASDIAVTALADESTAALATDGADDSADTYANIDSPLAPSRTLLSNDDLYVMTRTETNFPTVNQLWRTPINMNNSTGTPGNDGSYQTVAAETAPVAGRFFNLPTDARVEFGVYDGLSPTWHMNLVVPGKAAVSVPMPYADNGTTIGSPVVADFDGDGYDELLLAYSDTGSQADGNAKAVIFKAKSPDDPTQGFVQGPTLSLGSNYGIRAIAAGDFNGDGLPELAAVFIDGSSELLLQTYTVSKDFTAITSTLSTPAVVDTTYDWQLGIPIDLKVGKFTYGKKANTNQQIANQQLVLINRSGANRNMKLHIFDFNGDATPVVKTELDTGLKADRAKLAIGKFSWSDAADSIAMMTTATGDSPLGGAYSTQVQLLQVSPSLGLTSVGNIFPNSFGGTNYVAADIALGNFDNQLNGTRNPDSQLAIGIATPGGYNKSAQDIRIKEVGVGIVDLVTAGVVQPKPRGLLPIPQGKGPPTIGMTLVPGDYQGRSLRLGQGYKIAVDRTTPNVILAQPPVHADYALKSTTDTNPTLVNVTMSPNKINATYDVGTSTTVKSTNDSTQGWSFAAKEQIGTSVSFKGSTGMLSASGSVATTIGAQQAISKSTATKYGTTQQVSTNLNMMAKMDDSILFEEGTTYVYVYDLVGQKVCPVNSPNCTPDQQIPATVMFTAPGTTSTQIMDGATLPWYQPIWENGNVLSYPSDATQLTRQMSPDAEVMNLPMGLSTGSSGIKTTTNWKTSTENSIDHSWTKSLKEDSDIAVEGSVGVDLGVVSGNATTKLDLSFGGSQDFSGLRTSSTSLDSAMEMTTNKLGFQSPGTYVLTPLIIGRARPTGYDDGTDPAADPNWVNKNTPMVDMMGPVRSAYTVTNIAGDNGAFWPQYKAHPDIALNHPGRWKVQNTGTPIDTPSSNCVGAETGYMDCVTIVDPAKIANGINPFADPFHAMRGFFIFNKAEAVNPNDPNADASSQGLQQILATAGDTMTLETRVYNYSLADATNTTTVVNFYAMQWDSAAGKVVPQPNGSDSFYLGQYKGGGIPAAGNPNAANYTVASLDFDTSSYANMDLIFWVEAHALNPDGTEVTELAGKGLTVQQPFTSWAQAVAAEPTVADTWSVNGTQKTFANNIGVYPQLFHVKSPSPSTLSAALEAPTTASGLAATLSAVRQLSLRKVEAGRVSMALGDSKQIKAVVHNASAEPVEAPKVYFYDGDPANGGKAFGVQNPAYIASGADHQVEVRYTPETCGDHDIYMKTSHRGLLSPVATKAVDTIHVACAGETAPATGNAASGNAPSSSPAVDDGGCSVTPGSTDRNTIAGTCLLGLAVASLALRRRKQNA